MMLFKATKPKYLTLQINKKMENSLTVLVGIFYKRTEFGNAKPDGRNVVGESNCTGLNAFVEKGHRRSRVYEVRKRANQLLCESVFHGQQTSKLHLFKTPKIRMGTNLMILISIQLFVEVVRILKRIGDKPI